MYGKCKAFAQGSEEQGRGLHCNCLVWLEGFDKLRDSLFDDDPFKCQNARKELEGLLTLISVQIMSILLILKYFMRNVNRKPSFLICSKKWIPKL